MLNRTLIRLKAVQMLYAYLLTRSEFRLLPPPEKMTRDNKVAYDLYLDFLLMILQLSGFSVQASRRDPLGGLVLNRKINGSKMAKSLAADDNIRDIINLGNSSIALFDNAIPSLYRKIADSEALKEHSKIKSPDITDDIRLWVTIVRTIFAKDQEMIADARKMEDFTQTGYDRAITMVVDTLNNYNDAKGSLITARKNLEASLAKSYELYFDVFALMVELTHEQERRLQAAKEKYLPTAEDLNPNMRFVNNKFIAALENNEQFVKFMEKDPVNWNGDIYLIRDLLDRIVASEYYKEYMNNPEEPDFAANCGAISSKISLCRPMPWSIRLRHVRCSGTMTLTSWQLSSARPSASGLLPETIRPDSSPCTRIARMRNSECSCSQISSTTANSTVHILTNISTPPSGIRTDWHSWI